MAIHKISDEVIDDVGDLDLNKVVVALETEREMTITMHHKLNTAQLEIWIAGFAVGLTRR